MNKIFSNNKYKKLFNNKSISVGAKIYNCTYFNDLLKENKSNFILKNQSNLLNANYIITLTSGSTGSPKPIILTQKTKLLRALLVKKLYKYLLIKWN